jgi:hypothetical protein
VGEVYPFTPVKLFMGVLVANKEGLTHLLSLLEEHYGEIEASSEPVEFTFSDYYDSEMGGRPWRLFLIFKEEIDPERLASIKLHTNTLEEYFKVEGRRVVNLDPGIMGSASLILATTKNRSHRIPLQQGIYAEMTLHYSNKHYNSFPWTYPDYKSEEVQAFFLKARRSFLKQS